ncbi:hypothetical protein O181_066669 [Austropuccinia psidii MF-1]|uniref:Uncharacterized protein n=1 Tax=Austropuccinia psidii MF-1 TaxID=1389203 RepID=A0A9Q3ETW6_9BASI|nr:hypothetical protein [Austropuccinia psidii MF-1]
MKQMQDLLLTQGKKKGRRRQSTSFTPGASPSEPTLPRHVRPSEAPISPKPRPRATSTPGTESRPQHHQRRAFYPHLQAQVYYNIKHSDRIGLLLRLKMNIIT